MNFLRWLLIQVALVLLLAGLAAVYGGRVEGVSLAAVPLILLVYAGFAAYAGRLARLTDRGRQKSIRDRLPWVEYGSWTCQILGILCTVAGFWIIFSDGADAEALLGNIKDGVGVALMGTFIGVLCSKALALQERMLDHATT